MTSVITGDIIRSRTIQNPELWLNVLKKALAYLEPESKYWEIYRGDSFQIEIKNPEDSLKAAIYVKACIKMIKGLDVRLAIGIGNKKFQGNDVTESNGEAFIFSGETFETLKNEKQNLRIKTKYKGFNDSLNLYFSLASTIMDNWTVNSAEIVKLSLEQPTSLQQELAEQIGTNQNAISKRQKRAYLELILELDAMYRYKVKTLP